MSKKASLANGKKSNDARFNVGKEVIDKLNRLEKTYKVSKGNILKIALEKLIKKRSLMSRDEFINCMQLENLRLIISYSNIEHRSKKKLQHTISRIKFKKGLK